MDYGMIGKIEKAKRYAEEPDRFQFDEFSITFRGDNNNHQIRFDQGKWQCDCDFFHLRGVCCHSMALERILEHMLTVPSPV
ncbi:MAG: hypothetical protein ABSA10_01985 [Anaerolineales bacterium]|jgi:hypothetical protein